MPFTLTMFSHRMSDLGDGYAGVVKQPKCHDCWSHGANSKREASCASAKAMRYSE